MLYSKKVGWVPDEKNTDQIKQTNEIKIAGPMLDAIRIDGKTITADALLTQRAFASYLIEKRKAHYVFTVKGNQPKLKEDIEFYFDNINRRPDHGEVNKGHGRIERRQIWSTPDLQSYLDFPHVKQAFKIKREFENVKTGSISNETIYGITSKTEDEADAETIMRLVRGHWSIENSCHYILDWCFDEDRCRIKTGHGPENISRLRRFAIGLIKSKSKSSVAQKMRQLSFNTRAVLDCLVLKYVYRKANRISGEEMDMQFQLPVRRKRGRSIALI